MKDPQHLFIAGSSMVGLSFIQSDEIPGRLWQCVFFTGILGLVRIFETAQQMKWKGVLQGYFCIRVH